MESLVANVASRGVGGWVAATLAVLIVSGFVGYAGVTLAATVARAARAWWSAVRAVRRAAAAREAGRLARERVARENSSSEAYVLLRLARGERDGR